MSRNGSSGRFFPRRGRAAVGAIAQHVSIDGKDVFFDFVLLDILTPLAETAFKRYETAEGFGRFRRGKFHRPEMEIRIDKCDTVNIAAWFAADLTDETDLCFLVRIGHTQGQNFVGRESVAREDASTVTAEHDSLRFFGKHFAGRVGTEQDDGYFFCDAAASAFWVHRRVGTHSPWPREAQYAYRRRRSKLYRFEWAGVQREKQFGHRRRRTTQEEERISCEVRRY